MNNAETVKENAETLLLRMSELISRNELNLESKVKLINQIGELLIQIAEMNDEYKTIVEAGNLLNKISSTKVKTTLDFIVGVINDALAKVFPHDFKKIKVYMSSHMETYPQLRLSLVNSQGKERSLKTQEGNGVAQIISVLYTLALIYANGGRRFVILDEVLNGLHPDALLLMEDILRLFEDKLGFQTIIINHGYRPKRGRVYYLEKRNGTTAVVDVVDYE